MLLILHSRPHNTILPLHDGFVLGRMLRIRARRETLDDSVVVGTDKVWDGVASAGEALFSREAILEGREVDTVQVGLQDVLDRIHR